MSNKSALVVIRRGDDEMSSQMAESLIVPAIKKEYDKLQTEYYFIKRRDNRNTRKKIMAAKRKYGYNYIPSNKIIKALQQGFALFEYGIAMFVDKFMTIKERRE